MNANLPEMVVFRNKGGSVVEQKVMYEWKPTLCKYYDKYGHDEANCRKKKGQKPVVHEKNGQTSTVEQQNPIEIQKTTSQQTQGVRIGSVTNTKEGTLVNTKEVGNKDV